MNLGMSPIFGATNETGFTALPNGWRYGASRISNEIRIRAVRWTSQEAIPNSPWYRTIYYHDAAIYPPNPGDPSLGISVRCMKYALKLLKP